MAIVPSVRSRRLFARGRPRRAAAGLRFAALTAAAIGAALAVSTCLFLLLVYCAYLVGVPAAMIALALIPPLLRRDAQAGGDSPWKVPVRLRLRGAR